MILLNAIYTIIWLSTSGQNAMITLIYNNMFNTNRGYGYASAQAWVYTVAILLILGLCFLLLRSPKDKPLKEAKRRTLRHERRLED